MLSSLQHKHQSTLADLSLVFATIIWGTTFIVVKLTLGAIHPVTLNAFRFFIAAAVMALVLLWRRQPLWIHWRYGLVLGFILWIIFYSQTVGLVYTTATNSALLTGLFVLLTPFLGFIIFRHRVTWIKVAACCLAMLGLWLLTGGLKDFNVGDMLNVITAVAVAFQILFVDLYVKRVGHGLTLNFQQLLVVGVLSLLTVFIFGHPLAVASEKAWWSLIYLAVVATVLTLSIQLVGQRYTTPLRATLIFSLEPVFATFFAWWWGGELMTPVKFLGGGMIVLATIASELPLETILSRLFKKNCCTQH